MREWMKEAALWLVAGAIAYFAGSQMTDTFLGGWLIGGAFVALMVQWEFKARRP